MKQAKINTQLIACVLVMIVLSVGMGMVALRLGSVLTSAVRINGSRQILAGQLRAGTEALEGSARGLALASALQDQEEASQLKNRVQAAADSVGKVLSALVASTEDPQVRAELDSVEQDFRPLHAATEQMLTLMAGGKIDQAMTSFNQTMLPQMKRLREKSEKIMTRESQAFDRAVEDASRKNSTGQWTIFTLLAFTLAAGTLIAVFVRKISRRLQAVAGRLRASAVDLNESSTSVAHSSASLVDGASRQSASVEETSASTEQLSASTAQNAQTSQRMTELMRTTDQAVGEGNKALVEMTAAMKGINESSERIGKILKAIDEIAFQTNILALNAAVEAARAGEAGLGFAVVADEVRNLAQRCATAAGETAQLIEESAAKSAEGCSTLDRVTRSMAGITSTSSEVTGMAERLAASSQEQARGIQQIGHALQEIEQVTQQSVVASTNGSEAGNEMVRQAGELRAMVHDLVSMVGEPAGGRQESAVYSTDRMERAL